MSTNIHWNTHSVSLQERNRLNNHGACVLWFTGLSGSGKSTVANAVDRLLYEMNIHTYLLDGDNVRHGLNSDLAFDHNSRKENIRRIAEVAKLFVDAGLIVSSAFISPFRSDREQAKEIIGDGFIEVFIDTPIEVCASRDPKGLYQKAKAGEIANFTGISSPYEAPDSPDIIIKTQQMSIQESAQMVVDYLKQKALIG